MPTDSFPGTEGTPLPELPPIDAFTTPPDPAPTPRARRNPESLLGSPQDEATTFGQPSGEQRQAEAQGAAKAAKSKVEEEALSLADRFEEITKSSPRGYMQIERIGPAGIPRTEFGVVGKIAFKGLAEKDLAEAIEEEFGGGEYRVTAYTNRGRPIGSDADVVTVSGDYKPRSADGEKHLRDKSGVAAPTPGLTTKDALDLIEKANERNAAKQATEGSTLATILASMFNKDDRKQERELFEAKARHEKELAEIKSRADIAAVEAKAKADREEAERRDRRDREERESKERIENAKAAADIERERIRAEAKQERTAAIVAAKSNAMGMRTEAMRDIRLAQLQQAGSFDAAAAKVAMERWREVFSNEMFGGAPDAEEKGEFLDRIMENAVKPLMEKHGDKAIEMLGRLFTPNGQRPPMPPPGQQPPQSQQRQLPPPPAQPAPQPLPAAPVVDPAAGVDVSQAPPKSTPTATSADPNAPPVVTQEEAQAIVASGSGALIGRANAFLAAVLREMIADSDPASAWGTDAVEGVQGRTVEDLYYAMSKQYRESFPKGMATFKASLPPVECGAGVQMLERALQSGPAATWFGEFIAAGPWTDDGGDDEGDEPADAES